MPAKGKKLSEILSLSNYMRIAIDGNVSIDENGNYLINIAYLRVSTDRQAELGYGLEIQETAVRDYAIRNGLSNLVLFIDDGFTGTTMNRPALQGVIAMITAFNHGVTNLRVSAFIVPRLDRLGRTLLGTLQFIQDYIVSKNYSKNSEINQNAESVSFASVAEAYVRVDENDPQGLFLLGLFSTLAEYDRALIVQKMKAGKKARLASGKWPGGGNTPYGYRYDRENGTLVVIPEQAKKIQEAFRLYIHETCSPQRIANRLGFKGDRIVTQILRRKSLTGCIMSEGVEYSGRHEAIISLETWQKAQDELQKRSVYRVESHYLLAGLLVCGECGAKMRYQKWGKKGEVKIVCYSHQKSKPTLVKDENCQNQSYWADEVEKNVMDNLFNMTFHADAASKKPSPFIDPVEALENQLSIAKKRLSRLYGLNDVDNDEEFYKAVEQAKTQQRAIERQLAEEREKKVIANKILKTREILRDLKSNWGAMTEKEQQDVCRELIDKIVVFKDNTIEVQLKLKGFLAQN